MRYIDTSVLVPFLTPEIGSVAAENFMLSEGEPIAVSSWTEVEFLSALGIKYRTKQLSKSAILNVVDDYRNHLSPQLWHIEVEDLDHRQATSLLDGWRTKLRTGDSLHLAIAFARGAEIYTFDRGMRDAAKILGIPTFLVQ
jgi:predicted nucleic acid-binding protein